MFLKIRAVFLLFLAVSLTLLTLTVRSQPKKSIKPKPKVDASQQMTKLKKTPSTLLWEVSGNGLKEPSYLFGTMHILCLEDAKLSENLKKIIKESKKIYFEIDMDDREQMMGALKYVRMNDGVKLSDLLNKEEFERLEAYFKNKKIQIPVSMVNRFKPLFVSSMLGEKMMDCATQKGMEEQIMKESKQYDKVIMGLESVQYQAGLFDSIPYAKQAKDLMQYVDSSENYKKAMKEMVDVYKKQDLDRMDSLTRKSDPGMDEYMDLLLYNRNRQWVKQMPYLMLEGHLLFAVGAGHLPGDKGVIALLREAGFTVKPLKN